VTGRGVQRHAAVTAPRIVLASRSPRRAQLLGMLGLTFETVPADVDETYYSGEEPGSYARRLAREKAQAIAAVHRDAVVIGSDTVVVVDGDVLGKPGDAADAVRMLMRLQGRTHVVATGIAVVRDGAARDDVERVVVRFRPFDAALATEYVATGEPMDKAGAYGIQGYGAALVESIEGDYFAVMGLPIARLILLLQQTGLHYNFRELTCAEERS
jgi:septum formation protein